MCFSATASFVAGTALSVLGVATLRTTRSRREIAFAAIPLLFGLQQIVEGVLWLSFRFDAPQLNVAMTYLFSLFSHVLWPIFVPFSSSVRIGGSLPSQCLWPLSCPSPLLAATTVILPVMPAWQQGLISHTLVRSVIVKMV